MALGLAEAAVNIRSGNVFEAAELCFHIKRVLAASWAELYKYLMR